MRHHPRHTFLLALCMPLGVCCTLGCAATPRSTRLQPEDFNATVQHMVERLAASDFLAPRDADSEPVYITINKVENLTSDIITQAEQWMLMARVQGALSKPALARKRVYFQITPEQHARLRAEGFAGDLDRLPRTTHVMKAVFMSARRSERDPKHGYTLGEQDYYYLEYTITDLATRHTVWTETFEFKRQAVGLAID